MVIFFGYKGIVLSVIIFIILASLIKIKYKKDKYFFAFFIIFYIYIVFVISKTQFPIYNTEFERLMIGPVRLGSGINLIPFKGALNMTSILNIIMTVPFGFGLPFLIKKSIKKTVIAGMLFSFMLEMTQLIVALVVGYSFRKIDINDVIFNTLGCLVGYLIFMLFIKVVNILFKNSKDKLITYISGR